MQQAEIAVPPATDQVARENVLQQCAIVQGYVTRTRRSRQCTQSGIAVTCILAIVSLGLWHFMRTDLIPMDTVVLLPIAITLLTIPSLIASGGRRKARQGMEAL